MTKAYWAIDPSKPSTLMNIWDKLIPLALRPQFTIDDYNMMTRACLGYMLNIYSFPDMARLMKYKSESVKDYADEGQAFKFWLKMRRDLVATYQGALTIKLMLMRCTAREMNGKYNRLMQELQACELLENDAALFYHLDDLQLKFLLQKKLTALPVNNIPSVKEVKAEAEKVIKRNLPYTGKYVNKTLRFVYTSNNFQDHDVSADILYAAAQAYYLKVPFQTPEHIENTVKITIKNHGHKVRKFYNDTSRARLRFNQESGVWENIVITNHSTTVSDDEDDAVSHVNSDLGYSSFIDLENRMVVEDYVKLGGKNRKRIVKLLYSQDDSSFINFVKNKTEDCEIQSSCDIIDKYGNKEYYKFIAQFTGIKRRRVDKVVSELRNRLSGGNMPVKYQGNASPI